MPPDTQRFITLWEVALNEGLKVTPAFVYALLAWNWEVHGGTAPKITSGLRSAAHQLTLRRRWEMGDRRGLVVKPALSSAHVRGEAFDLVRGRHLSVFGVWIKQLGGRWGGDFSTPDPVHFDFPAS